MTSKSKQIVYAVLAIIGVCVTWYFNLQAGALDPDFSLATFISDNYVNPSSASIMNDIAVVCVVFFFWSFFEARNLGIKHWWVYVPLTLLIAIAFAFPLFLIMRERAIQRANR